MEDKLEIKLKELLPYVIVCGIVFLLLPLFMSADESFVTYLIQIGAFPLTALGCGVVYKYRKKRNSIYLCLVAPLFYALTALLYGMWRASWYTVLIYLIGYFICGYLGLMLGDILPLNKKNVSVRSLVKKPSQRPRRVNVEEEAEPEPVFRAEDPDEDLSLDTSTTEDDIEAILNSIHNRKQ